MTKRIRSVVAAGVLLSFLPVPAFASGDTGRFEGRVTAPDGRPAAGYSVLLVDLEGEVVARQATSVQGTFRFDGVPTGTYGLGVEDGSGQIAPVIGSPASLPSGASVRRDVKLLRNEGNAKRRQGAFGPRSESWWSRLTRTQKIATLVGIGVGAGAVVAVANNNRNKGEGPASAYR